MDYDSGKSTSGTLADGLERLQLESPAQGYEEPSKPQHAPRIKRSPIAGHGLFATEDLPIGSTAMSTVPTFPVLDTKRLPDTCAYCHTWSAQSKLGDRGSSEKVKMRACTACKTNRYCSKKCQAADWKRYHKLECKILQKTNQKGTLPNAARLVIQMMQTCSPWESTPVRHLTSHKSEILAGRDKERRENLLVLSTGILHYSGGFVSLDIIQSLMALVFTNSLTIYTSTFDPLGICVDPVACSANHSCDPNIAVVFNGNEMIFRAIKPIRKDEELLLPYIDSSDPFQRRQDLLKERYYFTCTCTKCQLGPTGKEDTFLYPQANLPLNIETQLKAAVDKLEQRPAGNTLSPAPSPKKPANTLNHATQMIQSQAYAVLAQKGARSGNISYLHDLDAALQSCTKSSVWPEVRQPIPALRQEIFISLLMAGKWSLAFRHGLRMYFFVHPALHAVACWPARVVHGWTMGMLALYLADYSRDTSKNDDEAGSEDARQLTAEGLDWAVVVLGFVIEVESNVHLSHGNSEFARTVKSKMEEVCADISRGHTGAPGRALSEVKGRIQEQWGILRRIAEDTRLQSVGIQPIRTVECTTSSRNGPIVYGRARLP